MSAQRNKTCFVIGEIGDVGSQTRMRADWVFENIIRKAVEERGYHPIRSDKVAKPGCMTPQMMTLLYESPLVIADLTNLNSNVFYGRIKL